MFGKQKVDERCENIVNLFPDKLKIENNEVSIARSKEPWPHHPDHPYQYATHGWSDVGITAVTVALNCNGIREMGF